MCSNLSVPVVCLCAELKLDIPPSYSLPSPTTERPAISGAGVCLRGERQDPPRLHGGAPPEGPSSSTHRLQPFGETPQTMNHTYLNIYTQCHAYISNAHSVCCIGYTCWLAIHRVCKVFFNERYKN